MFSSCLYTRGARNTKTKTTKYIIIVTPESQAVETLAVFLFVYNVICITKHFKCRPLKETSRDCSDHWEGEMRYKLPVLCPLVNLVSHQHFPFCLYSARAAKNKKYACLHKK